jgi:hypothetical protein
MRAGRDDATAGDDARPLGRVPGGVPNRSAAGSEAGGLVPCTRPISSLTAVDSVFAMRAGALRIGFGRSSEKPTEPAFADSWIVSITYEIPVVTA